MARRTGLPCTTMSHAIVRALRALGLDRVAVATAYIDDVNERLVAYLAASDIAATAVRGSGDHGRARGLGRRPPRRSSPCAKTPSPPIRAPLAC